MAQSGKGLLATAQSFPASRGGGGERAPGCSNDYRGKGGVRSDFLRETIWRLGEKFPFWHMTHEALTPFPAWSTPPSRLGLASPQPLSPYPAVSQSLCAQNVWPTLFRLAPKSHGFLDANTIPGAHSPSCNFHILPRETNKVKEENYSLNSTPQPLPTVPPSPAQPLPPRTLGYEKTPSLKDLPSDTPTKTNL